MGWGDGQPNFSSYARIYQRNWFKNVKKISFGIEQTFCVSFFYILYVLRLILF